MNVQQICSNDKDEWYTPSWLLRLCREYLKVENFAYDLASCEKAAKLVNAVFHFSKEYSFLTNCQAVSVFEDFWLNPPFSKVDDFSLILHYLWEENALNRGFILVNANTETRWFHRLMLISDYIVILNKRIQFIHPETLLPVKGNPKGQVLFYVGPYDLSTASEFWRDYGTALPTDKVIFYTPKEKRYPHRGRHPEGRVT